MDRCPHLDYREAAGDREFDVPRAYCTVADRFVQPVRADVCNARYDLSPPEHCEIYREHEGIEDPWLVGEGSVDGQGDADGEGGTDEGEGAEGSGEDEGREKTEGEETEGEEVEGSDP